MQSENGLLVDVGQIRHVVQSAEVFAIGFGQFEDRLLVDTRSDADNGPMVRVVAPLASAHERYFWLGKERPAFGPPDSFVLFAWPHSIAFLEESGIWGRIRDRVDAGRDPSADWQCDVSLEELRALEQGALIAAIKGTQYVSLWSRDQNDGQD